jgi:hypothetical protein
MNTSFHVIKNALPCFIQAQVKRDKANTIKSFRVLTENITETLSWGMKELEAPSLKRVEVVFMDDLGVKADVLKEIAETASDVFIQFDLLPKGVPKKLKGMFVKETNIPILRISHGGTRQYLKLKKQEKRLPIVFDFENEPDEPELDKWIAKAVGKDRDAPESQKWMRKHYGFFAADGFRIHMGSDLDEIEHEGYAPPEVTLNFITKIQKSKNCPSIFHSAQLKQAVKTASVFNKKCVGMKLKPRKMDVISLTDEKKENGKTTIGHKYTGKAIVAYFNPKFMLDALSGMKGEVTLRLVDTAIWMKCGSREAFIAMMIVPS